MKTKGINRVAILVKDIDNAVALYSELLNTTFYPVTMADEHGIRTMISYEAGIELASPIPGFDGLMAQNLTQQIEERGEGLYAVVFSVDDIEQAHAKAKEMGIWVLYKMELDADETKRNFHGRYSTFIEYFLHPEDAHGVQVVL